jgi:hypothetical protein
MGIAAALVFCSKVLQYVSGYSKMEELLNYQRIRERKRLG